jgi:hypothetical protein
MDASLLDQMQTAPHFHAMWFNRKEVEARLPGYYHSLPLYIGLELAKHYIHIGGQFEAAEHIARVGMDLARNVSQPDEKATLLFGFAHSNIKAKLKVSFKSVVRILSVCRICANVSFSSTQLRLYCFNWTHGKGTERNPEIVHCHVAYMSCEPPDRPLFRLALSCCHYA